MLIMYSRDRGVGSASSALTRQCQCSLRECSLRVRKWETHLLSGEVGEKELLYQMIRNQRGKFSWLHHPFTGQ